MTSAANDQLTDQVAALFHNHEHILVMGVLNVTPDSFSDGGHFFDLEQAVRRFHQMVAEGADVVDIGGESSRPGSQPISPEAELERVLPVIERVRSGCEIPISIDTYKAAVAEAALQAGASIVNDISALHDDPHLAEVVARHDAGLILMHKRGTPANMQTNTHYRDLICEIKSYLKEAIAAAEAAGVSSDRIMIDPGIGFGKDLAGNLEIIRSLHRFSELGKPVLIGASRKSFIGGLTGAPVTDRVPGSLAAATAAVLNGAAAVRVHDVAATRQAVDVAGKLRVG